jgi:methylmalonyl-CoA/ethylmalonyl-CoA epimerase
MRYIKHMAFAVSDLDKALKYYQDVVGVGHDARVVEASKARIKVAIFNVADVEYQLNQSMDADGRFSKWIDERGHEGLHHICYAVENIDEALANAQAQGITLKECSSCKVTGSHPHPEGFVAFLQEEVGGIETELMQVYTPEELNEYKSIRGI